MKTIKNNNIANNSLTLQNKTSKRTGTVHPSPGAITPRCSKNVPVPSPKSEQLPEPPSRESSNTQGRIYFTPSLQNKQCIIGIDVSKSSLHIASFPKVFSPFEIPYDSSEHWETLISTLHKFKPLLIVLEASGGYEKPVCKKLKEAGFKVEVVNPERVRYFANSLGYLAKTDKIDARVIAHYGAVLVENGIVYGKEDKELEKLKELKRRRDQIVEMIVKEKNRLKQAEKGILGEEIRRSIEKVLEVLEKEKRRLEEEIEKRLNEAKEIKRRVKLLETIPGVSTVTAVSVVVEMPELGKIERRKVVALSGLAPFARESGNLKGKRMIKGGRKRVRQALYMAVLAGIIWNKKIRGYYERLVEEKKKAKKVALTACMRKLLLIMHQMLKNGVGWQENYDGKNLVAAS